MNDKELKKINKNLELILKTLRIVFFLIAFFALLYFSLLIVFFFG
jgi:hypothetical protein